MNIHKLLLRQLEKVNSSVDRRPETDEQWRAFIQKINNSYLDADQERYLHERSMEISSREMMNLNMKLENAQHIAKLGYWSYDGISKHVILSNELFFLFQLDPAQKPPTYHEFIELVYKQDRYDLVNKIEAALNNGIDYESEARIKNKNGEYRWYRIVGRCLEGARQLEGIVMDIHNDKIAEEKIRELNQQISSTARRAGMAEVAATILHNIGNILNSSNVSITMLKNSFNQQYQQKLLRVFSMLLQHSNDLVNFLTHNAKGKLIPKYIISLSKIMQEDSRNNLNEIDSLKNDLKHISQIVNMQKSVSGLSNLKEKVYFPDVLDIALNMSMSGSNNETINISKKFDDCPLIDADKSKLLQILVNIIQNARDAVLFNPADIAKEIELVINKTSNNMIRFLIKDNGVGINPEDLNRIFSFGFTTKINGHGFGLHSASLSVREMGGSLIAESLGEGLGAQFILTLPIKSFSEYKGGSNV